MNVLDATQQSLDDLVAETGKDLGRHAAAVALYAEQQRQQLVLLLARGEPGYERAVERALASVRLFAGVEAVKQGDEFDARFAAIIGVALRAAA